MASWSENGYTYYGVQTLSKTARQQEPGSMTCWAFALGAILGVSWGTVATHTSLNAMIKGANIVEVRQLYIDLNASAASQGWSRLRELARWYSPGWDGQTLEENFPQALAITGHFVVALAIGKANDGQQPDRIRYWEPGDAQIYTITVNEFGRRFAPEFGVAKVV
jgi:hypothetical protein